MSHFEAVRRLVPVAAAGFLALGCSPEPYAVNPDPDSVKSGESVPESQKDGYMRIIGDFRWDKSLSPEMLASSEAFKKYVPRCAYGEDRKDQSLRQYLQKRYNKDGSANGYSFPTKDGLRWKYAFGGMYATSLVDDSILIGYGPGKSWILLGGRGSDLKKSVYPDYSDDDCKLSIGGVAMKLARASFASHPNTTPKSILGFVDFTIANEAEARAFEAAIKGKYSEVFGGNSGNLYCSKYSCFSLRQDYETLNDNYELAFWFRITPTSYATSILDSVKLDPSEF